MQGDDARISTAADLQTRTMPTAAVGLPARGIPAGCELEIDGPYPPETAPAPFSEKSPQSHARAQGPHSHAAFYDSTNPALFHGDRRGLRRDRNTNLTNHEKSRSYPLPCYHCITRPQPTASETLKPEAAQEGDNLVTKGVDLIRTREVKLLVEPGHHTSAVYDSHSPRAHLRGAGRFWRWANSTPSKASASPGVTSLVRG
jgi:hypothetical protein